MIQFNHIIFKKILKLLACISMPSQPMTLSFLTVRLTGIMKSDTRDILQNHCQQPVLAAAHHDEGPMAFLSNARYLQYPWKMKDSYVHG